MNLDVLHLNIDYKNQLHIFKLLLQDIGVSILIVNYITSTFQEKGGKEEANGDVLSPVRSLCS